MTLTTKIMKVALYIQGQFRPLFMAVIAGTTTGIIDKIVMTISTRLRLVINMFKRYRQERPLYYGLLTRADCQIDQHNRQHHHYQKGH
ncbi:MAG: hypothetical protein AAGF35_01770 [Pseudomonadota bacterium]